MSSELASALIKGLQHHMPSDPIHVSVVELNPGQEYVNRYGKYRFVGKVPAGSLVLSVLSNRSIPKKFSKAVEPNLRHWRREGNPTHSSMTGWWYPNQLENDFDNGQDLVIQAELPRIRELEKELRQNMNLVNGLQILPQHLEELERQHALRGFSPKTPHARESSALLVRSILNFWGIRHPEGLFFRSGPLGIRREPLDLDAHPEAALRAIYRFSRRKKNRTFFQLFHMPQTRRGENAKQRDLGVIQNYSRMVNGSSIDRVMLNGGLNSLGALEASQIREIRRLIEVRIRQGVHLDRIPELKLKAHH